MKHRQAIFFFLCRLPLFCCYGRLSSWVKIRLHTENQLPRLPGSALKVPVVGGVGWWVGSYPLSSQAPTHVEVELGCDNYVGVETRMFKFWCFRAEI